MIYLLKEYANEEFDVAKAMMMALIHDIVEIDAGDMIMLILKLKKIGKKKQRTESMDFFLMSREMN